MSIPSGIAVGLGVSLAVTLLGAAVTASLLSKEMMTQLGLGYGAMITLLAASAAGGFTAWRMIRHRRLLVCGIHGAGYLALLLGVTALLFGGGYQGIGVTAAVILAGDGVVAWMGLKGEKTRKYRYTKIRSR